MNFAQLRAVLRDGVKPVYVLFGVDGFLVNKAIEMISAGGSIDRFNEEASVREVVSSANTFDMFGGRRVVVARVDEKFLKDKDFTKYVASPNPSTTLIIISGVEKSPNVKGAEVVDCNPMTGDVVVKLIAKQFQDKGKNISAVAANKLAQLCNNNFSRISNEVDKLANFVEAGLVDVAHVEDLVIKEEEYQIYEFSNALLRGDYVASERMLENFKVSGVEDYAIFGSLVATLRRVFYSISTKADKDEVGKFLKVNPFSVHYTRRDFGRLQSKIANLYGEALDLEYKIKSGQLTAHSAITSLMLR